MDKVYRVRGKDRYVLHIAEYKNGIDTSGGFYSKDELEPTCNVLSITYDARHATELPVGWHRMRFLDDSNKRQFIKEVLFNTDKPYLMEDGTLSQEVTE